MVKSARKNVRSTQIRFFCLSEMLSSLPHGKVSQPSGAMSVARAAAFAFAATNPRATLGVYVCSCLRCGRSVAAAAASAPGRRCSRKRCHLKVGEDAADPGPDAARHVTSGRHLCSRARPRTFLISPADRQKYANFGAEIKSHSRIKTRESDALLQGPLGSARI